MRGLKKKMTGKEWREFYKNIIAGIFGGIIVLAWSLAYESLKDASFQIKIILPSVLTIALLIILTLILKYLLVEKPELKNQ